MPTLSRVAECLYRSDEGIYYALIKTGGKQIKRSLRTNDGPLAKRKLREFRDKAKTLVVEKEQTSFKDASARWLEQMATELKPSSWKRRESTVKGLLPVFGSIPVRRIGQDDIEQWKRSRGAKLSERSYNMETETLRLVLDYCRDRLHIILENAAAHLKRKKLPKRKAHIPSKVEFSALLKEMRSEASQHKGSVAANLVEFLGYSGCRLTEALNVRWHDVDFEQGRLLITGGDQGTKNSEQRVIPLFGPLARFLRGLRTAADGKPLDRLFDLASAKKAIANGCRRLKLTKFTHHSFRHFFGSNCIEAGVDFKTIAEWLGHKDGGILVAQTYGHLRAEHSHAMAQKITFDATSLQP